MEYVFCKVYNNRLAFSASYHIDFFCYRNYFAFTSLFINVKCTPKYARFSNVYNVFSPVQTKIYFALLSTAPKFITAIYISICIRVFHSHYKSKSMFGA